MPNIVYRWRPWPDQDSTLMEVRIIARDKKGADASDRKAVTMHMLSDDEPWTAATELGALGGIFDQDMANPPSVQDGLKGSKTGEVTSATIRRSASATSTARSTSTWRASTRRDAAPSPAPVPDPS